MIKPKIHFDLNSKRQFLLLTIGLALFVALFFMEPIAQDQQYHQFADQQSLLGIPHFWNVISNIPFLLVGLLGLKLLLSTHPTGGLSELRFAYITFFIGLVMTSIGSSYYHWNPNNSSLVWDRLPMTISFMAFFVVVLGENISLTFARRIFYPLLIAGIASVLYWRFTELNGTGDLRPYVLVQFLPVIMIPLILWLFPSPFKGQRYIVMVLIAYMIAKLLEHYDHQIYQNLVVMSGHAIKHVIAAIGTYFFYVALIKRKFM